MYPHVYEFFFPGKKSRTLNYNGMILVTPVYLCSRKELKPVISLVYVEDKVHTRNDTSLMAYVLSFQGSQFKTIDLGPLKYFLD